MRVNEYWLVWTTTFWPCSFLASQHNESPRRVIEFFDEHPTCGPTAGTRENATPSELPALYQTSEVRSPTNQSSLSFSYRVMRLSVDESLRANKRPGNNKM